jgi:hypothetical protein
MKIARGIVAFTLQLVLAVPLSAKYCPSGITARTLAQACSEPASRTRDYSTDNCLKAGKSEILDQCALGMCSEMDTMKFRIECIKSIRGRAYQNSELDACKKRFDRDGEEAANDCLGLSGKSSAFTQLMQSSKERGVKLGEEDADKTIKSENKPDFGLNEGKKNGERRGRDAGENYAKLVAFNEGFADAKKTNSIPDAAGLAKGMKAGADLAATDSKKHDYYLGYNEALKARFKKPLSPESTITTSLKEDKTVALNQGTHAIEWYVWSMRVGEMPPPPKGKALSAPMKPTTSRTDPSYSDLPYVGYKSPTSRTTAPCDGLSDRDCISAFDNGYREGFKNRYHKVFSDAYRDAYEKAHSQALDQALLQTDISNSKKEGFVAGSEERGLLEGYETERGIQKTFWNQAGRDQLDKDLKTRPLARLVSIEFASPDGMTVTPKNAIQLTVTVDNLSDAPSPAGYYRLRAMDRGRNDSTEYIAYWQNTFRYLPAIPANTRARFEFAFNGRTNSIDVGKLKKERFALEVASDADGGYQEFDQLEVKALPQYPVTLISMKPLSGFKEGGETATVLTLRNDRKVKSEPFVASVASVPEGVKVLSGSRVEVPALDPGATFEWEAKLQPTLWTNHKTPTDFALTLKDSNEKILSTQLFPFLVDVGREIGMQIEVGYVHQTNRTAYIPTSSKTVLVTVFADCTKEWLRTEGYNVLFVESTDPSFSIVGRPGSYIRGYCLPGAKAYLYSATFRVPEKPTTEPAALRFYLERNGTVVQRAQVFLVAQDP